MATELGVAYISLLPEMKSFRPAAEKGIDKVGKGVATRFGVGFNGAIGSIVSRSAGIFAAGFAGVKIGGFLKDAISQASDLNETTSKVGQIFGPAAKDILKFSKTSATALGQTQQAALDANATFGIFGKSAGLQGKDLTGFTTKLTTLAGDLASFNNTSPEQAIEAIGAALRGESEPIRAYGVLLDDASLRQEALSQGLIKTTKQALTPQQKVLAAQALIMKQTTTAQGDFARTSGGLANQQRILSARFSDFKTSLGTVALPLATKFFGFLNDKAIPVLSEVKGGFIAFSEAFKANDGDITSSGFPGFMERVGFAARKAFDVFRTDVLPTLKDFGAFITGTVLPALGAFAAGLAQKLGPVVRELFNLFKTNVLPVLQDLATFVYTKVLPAVVSFAGFLTKTLLPAVKNLVKNGMEGAKVAIDRVKTAFQENEPQIRKFISVVGVVVQWIAQKLGPILGWLAGKQMKWVGDQIANVITAFGKFISAIGAVINWVKTAGAKIAQVWTGVKTASQSALAFVVVRFLDFVGAMINGAAKAFGWVPGIGPKLKTAAAEFQKFKTGVNKSLAAINDQTIKVDLKYSSSGVNLTAPSSVGRRAMGGPGGPVRGPGSTTSDRAGLYALSNREWVIRAKATQKYGDYAMAMVNAGRATIIPDGGFASGGRPGLRLDTAFPSSSFPASATSATAKTYAVKFAEAFAKQMGVNPRLAGALNFARGQAGKPYVWGGVGPGGYDCSGFLSAIVNVAQGRSPYQRRFATGSMPAGLFAPGPGAFSVGWFRGNPGHTAGTLNGVNVESRGGQGVVVGSGARGATNGLFNSGVYHLKGYAKGGRVGDAPFDLLNPRGKQYLGDDLAREILPKALSFDNGGLLPTGYSIVHNGTGSPEPVGHDFLRSSDLAGMRMELDAPGVGVLTGFIRRTAQGEINRSNRELKRRVGRN